MRVLLAFDKFKHALGAAEACAVAARAFRRRYPEAECDECPLTDGGEGFAGLLTRAVGGEIRSHRVTGPSGHAVAAAFGIAPGAALPPDVWSRLLGDKADRMAGGQLAIIEMASASGLALVPEPDRNPWVATSAGTGELIREATRLGVRAILLGVGGSATNDMGLGALSRLGYSFLDAAGGIVDPVPANWGRIKRIAGGPPPDLPPILIACDVNSPLCGQRGATAVFGPQKGVRPADVARLDAEVARMAAWLGEHRRCAERLSEFPGAGAAGGIAFGLMVGTGARLVSGAELFAAWFRLKQRILAADLILTGEGRFDESSLAGKGPGAVVALARAAGKPLHVFAGSSTLPGADWLHPITPVDMPLPTAIPLTSSLLETAVMRANLEA